MDKKLLLFNYMLKKLVEIEKTIFKIPTFELGLTNLVLCKEDIKKTTFVCWNDEERITQEKHAQTNCFTHKAYLEWLLFSICIWDINEETGEHILFKTFTNFIPTVYGITDKQIREQTYRYFTDYIVQKKQIPPKEIFKLSSDSQLYQTKNIWIGKKICLTTPPPCIETEHIDKAISELCETPFFIKALQTTKKPAYLSDIISNSRIYKKHKMYDIPINIKDCKDALAERKNFLLHPDFTPNQNIVNNLIQEEREQINY